MKEKKELKIGRQVVVKVGTLVKLKIYARSIWKITVPTSFTYRYLQKILRKYWRYDGCSRLCPQGIDTTHSMMMTLARMKIKVPADCGFHL